MSLVTAFVRIILSLVLVAWVAQEHGNLIAGVLALLIVGHELQSAILAELRFELNQLKGRDAKRASELVHAQNVATGAAEASGALYRWIRKAHPGVTGLYDRELLIREFLRRAGVAAD